MGTEVNACHPSVATSHFPEVMREREQRAESIWGEREREREERERKRDREREERERENRKIILREKENKCLQKITGQENKTGEQEILKVRIHVLRRKRNVKGVR